MYVLLYKVMETGELSFRLINENYWSEATVKAKEYLKEKVVSWALLLWGNAVDLNKAQ